VINANELESRRTFTLAIAMHAPSIYALIVKSTNVKPWQIKRWKFMLIKTEFTVMTAIEWNRNKVMPLGIAYNVMDVQRLA